MPGAVNTIRSTAWEGAAIMVDHASRRRELSIKEALHIQLTPEQQRFNRDVGLELLDCWVATLNARP